MKLASLFCDNMVFQAEKPVRIFGTGKGCVSVKLKGEIYQKTFDENDWVMELPKQAYGGPYEIEIDLQGEKRVLKNIAFGDVFLCSGQSNMQFEIQSERFAASVPADSKIRYFCCDRLEAHPGLKSADGWRVCEESDVWRWSALGTHIAQKYREKRDVFVGIVGCFQGASVIRSWLSEKYLDESVYVPLEKRHEDSYLEAYSLWNGDGVLYKNMFFTLVPFSFKAAVWYQGESDTSVAEGEVYTQLLSKLIDSWREALRSEDLPFIVVQICDFISRMDEGWYAIQAAQERIVKIRKNVALVTSKDVCEHSDIHPCNKEKLAEKICAVMVE